MGDEVPMLALGLLSCWGRSCGAKQDGYLINLMDPAGSAGAVSLMGEQLGSGFNWKSGSLHFKNNPDCCQPTQKFRFYSQVGDFSMKISSCTGIDHRDRATPGRGGLCPWLFSLPGPTTCLPGFVSISCILLYRSQLGHPFPHM